LRAHREHDICWCAWLCVGGLAGAVRAGMLLRVRNPDYPSASRGNLQHVSAWCPSVQMLDIGAG
jgi:hypothetical protein